MEQEGLGRLGRCEGGRHYSSNREMFQTAILGGSLMTSW